MYRSPTCLWLLPDLGMDSRLLKPQADYFSNLQSPSLANHAGCENLAEFAKRSVDRWLSNQSDGAPTDKAFFLGGVGFGGLLALELALELASRSVCPAGVLLIGSARSRAFISTSFRLKHAMLCRLPPSVGRWQLGNSFRRIASSEAMTPSCTRLLLDMAHDVDWSLFRWQSMAMSRWDRHRTELETSGFPIYQLHGRRDRTFRVPSVEDASLLIHGQQLVNLSLAAEVNRWIESILRNHDLRRSQSCES